MENKTTLYETHLAMGAKMVEFGGFLMPVQYPAGVLAEHKAVRTAAGLFDVSHMGEIMVSGNGALATLQHLLTNDFSTLQDGECRYSPMCNPEGGIIDDLIVYRLGQNSFMLVVNASNREKDLRWISSNTQPDTNIGDISQATALLALQGPNSQKILAKLCNEQDLPQKNYTFSPKVVVNGVDCLVSRTGYTGENGFEIYFAAAKAPALWEAILKAGQPYGILPCGLAARDTLRLEAGMPLYGQEMSDQITPREAGIGFFVKMDKPEFIGKTALEQKGAPTRLRTGLRMVDRGIARQGAKVYQNGKEVGEISSGTQLPFMGYAGAMAFIDKFAREQGSMLQVDVRGRMLQAQVVKLPFYTKQG